MGTDKRPWLASRRSPQINQRQVLTKTRQRRQVQWKDTASPFFQFESVGRTWNRSKPISAEQEHRCTFRLTSEQLLMVESCLRVLSTVFRSTSFRITALCIHCKNQNEKIVKYDGWKQKDLIVFIIPFFLSLGRRRSDVGYHSFPGLNYISYLNSEPQIEMKTLKHSTYEEMRNSLMWESETEEINSNVLAVNRSEHNTILRE